MANDQQQAADEIARQSAQLLAASQDGDEEDASANAGKSGPGDEGDDGQNPQKASRRREAAERLTQAESDFANAQRGTGEAAEELTNQSQVANSPLRQAMKLVSSLPSQEDHGPKGSLGSGDEVPNSNASGSELGTGFVPNSPEATAAVMAGAEATSKAAAELGGKGSSKQAGQGGESFPDPDSAGGGADDAGESGTGDGNEASPDQAAGKGTGQSDGKPSGGAQGESQGARDRMNAQRSQGMSSATGGAHAGPGGSSSLHDSSAAARDMSHESWFTKLPPELRKSIRARAQRPPPRSYEEKLQKYFESLD